MGSLEGLMAMTGQGDYELATLGGDCLSRLVAA
jgi:hypothetical protein